ncbi:cystatin-A2-like [Limulus polyphemus]|uniref:Cystatin-A2-like n=1 Tax=Limulus polyphemus TaxID=6850 RepID=A0ABM1BBH3_LIMPO|nr:cystatin-A2-like [Limulus polyphemus]
MSCRVGGTSEVKEVDDVVREVCNKVREMVEKQAGKSFAEFTPVGYKSQIVNGVNYFIKVKVSEADHLHVRAHKSFQGEVTLAGYQEGKAHDDEIEYF